MLDQCNGSQALLVITIYMKYICFPIQGKATGHIHIRRAHRTQWLPTEDNSAGPELLDLTDEMSTRCICRGLLSDSNRLTSPRPPAGNHHPINSIALRPSIPSNPLKVVTVVNGGGDGGGRDRSSGDGAGDAVARAGGCVSLSVAGSGGVGGKSAGRDGGGAVLEVALGRGGGSLVIDGDSHGAILSQC